MPSVPIRHSVASRQRKVSGAYDRSWRRFRQWYAGVVPPICVDCGIALESKLMHLDHDPPITCKDDPGRLDPERVKWRCAACHGRKTATHDGGFGNE